MSALRECEKQGLKHFFQCQPDNTLLLQVTKTITKNILSPPPTEQEALNIIFLHSNTALNILNRRLITKELLYKYLITNNVGIGFESTKTNLIHKVIEFWGNIPEAQGDDINAFRKETHQPELQVTKENTEVAEESYPINLLARKFAEWFFRNLNEDKLKTEDFWPDACLTMKILADDCVKDEQAFNSSQVLSTFSDIKGRFNFFFNPNVSHAGVQGRMDTHGLVLVLSCGTLHILQNCVGVFESIFGLVRDPFSENNWKVKTIKIDLKSSGLGAVASLEKCETMREMLCLPISGNDID